MITHFEIDSFKSLRSVKMDLGNINVFVGPNGVGKTNILEAIGIASTAAYGVVDDESLLRRGIRPGVPRLYKTSNKKYKTASHISFFVGNDICSYKVSLLNPLEKPLPKWHFKTERVTLNGKDLYTRGVKNNINSENGGIPAVLAMENIPNEVLDFFNDLRAYGLYSPNTPALRGLVPDLQSRIPIGLSGGGLSEGLQALLETAESDDVIADAIDDVTALFDWVEDVETSTQNANIISPSLPRMKRTVIFRDAFMKSSYNKLTAADASEGVLYALFLLVLCLSEKGPRIFSVDNIDSALNPRLVKALLRRIQLWMKDIIPEKQMFCTVHNPVALDSFDFTDERVRLFVIDRNSDGLTNVRQIKITEHLLNISKEKHMPLSQLWIDGYIGGVPDV